MKKILTVCCATLVLIIAGFGYLRFTNQRGVTNFAGKYRFAYKATGDYMVAVVAANVTENSKVAEFGEKYKEILDILYNPAKRSERKKIAEEAIEIKKELDRYLIQSDADETVASQFLLYLNTDAVKIKNSDLRKQAIEIADLMQEYFDLVSDYKRTVSAKSQLQKDLLQTLIADGRITGFIAFLEDKENQEKIQKQNTELENADFAKIDTQLNTAFARFKGAANIK